MPCQLREGRFWAATNKKQVSKAIILTLEKPCQVKNALVQKININKTLDIWIYLGYLLYMNNKPLNKLKKAELIELVEHQKGLISDLMTESYELSLRLEDEKGLREETEVIAAKIADSLQDKKEIIKSIRTDLTTSKVRSSGQLLVIFGLLLILAFITLV